MTGLDWISTVLLFTGCFFALTGGVGLVRMPDFYTRLHPAGKSDTAAQGLILVALAVQAMQSGDVTTVAKLGLLAALLFVTAPAATHAISRAAQLDGLKPVLADDAGTQDGAAMDGEDGDA